MFNKILENGGAVITEYDKDVDVFSQGFRDRNRIVAGLSVGTLVVEAKVNSGTSITAGFVQSFKRELFCIPHALDDEAGVGTNKWIKKGAKLVTEVEDMLEYFNNIQEIEDKELIVEVPEEYKKVFELISKEPINADEIMKKTNMNISEVNTILTMLELEGFIESVPGNYFKRKVI